MKPLFKQEIHIWPLPRGERTFSSLWAVGIWIRLFEDSSSDKGRFLCDEEEWLMPALPSLVALENWDTCSRATESRAADETLWEPRRTDSESEDVYGVEVLLEAYNRGRQRHILLISMVQEAADNFVYTNVKKEHKYCKRKINQYWSVFYSKKYTFMLLYCVLCNFLAYSPYLTHFCDCILLINMNTYAYWWTTAAWKLDLFSFESESLCK